MGRLPCVSGGGLGAGGRPNRFHKTDFFSWAARWGGGGYVAPKRNGQLGEWHAGTPRRTSARGGGRLIGQNGHTMMLECIISQSKRCPWPTLGSARCPLGMGSANFPAMQPGGGKGGRRRYTRVRSGCAGIRTTGMRGGWGHCSRKSRGIGNRATTLKQRAILSKAQGRNAWGKRKADGYLSENVLGCSFPSNICGVGCVVGHRSSLPMAKDTTLVGREGVGWLNLQICPPGHCLNCLQCGLWSI